MSKIGEEGKGGGWMNGWSNECWVLGRILGPQSSRIPAPGPNLLTG